ncbi:hypothetical protein ITP53_14295 [Nonomuraea sp. K274]|uniref:OAA-family lectin sugar binding domain-containing protein n=1 Tax=Nonomuraea cypriaca TaxID=1187855 RepID=A0A931EWN0_9ACTN|nr:hypothetical protein [Nonomuraea cypriaca]MBF8186889.1 hypothetical protein [Nonomuraea cypriaca]
MATYTTQIQWGGADAEWHDDADLTIVISNRDGVVPQSGMPGTGTQVAWASPQGNGSITFFEDGNRFMGSAQFKGEGPVGYRGLIKH